MDSLSQLVLGAGVGVAVMGRRTAVWKAALWGGTCGTLPDLDVFIDHGDPLRNMTFHRAESHALLYLTAASPLIAGLITRIHGERDRFAAWWLAVWLALVTHALLDTMTIYGTQLGLPFTDYPYGIGSMFIIDPLYTLPLLLGLITCGVDRSPQRLRWNTAGVVVSSMYLVWSMAAQANVENRARAALAAEGVLPERMLATPTALNTLLWRIVVIESGGAHYREGFYSVFDGDQPIHFERFARGSELHAQVAGFWPVQRMAWFTHGFFRMDEREGVASIADLRMGQEPGYVFRFNVARRTAQGGWSEGNRADVGSRGDARAGLAWLWARLFDARVAPLARGDHSPVRAAP